MSKFDEDVGFVSIQNKNLVCKDCQYLNPVRTDICPQYPDCKPPKVLSGGTCPLYRKKA